LTPDQPVPPAPLAWRVAARQRPRRIEVLEPRSVLWRRSPDHDEVRAIRTIEIWMDHKIAIPMLFRSGHNLDERILREQFATNGVSRFWRVRHAVESIRRQ